LPIAYCQLKTPIFSEDSCPIGGLTYICCNGI
jgi:hypothetical protein